MEVTQDAATEPAQAGNPRPPGRAMGWERKGCLAHGGLSGAGPSPTQLVLGRPRPDHVRPARASAAVCLVNRRMRGPHVRWCGWGGATPPPTRSEPAPNANPTLSGARRRLALSRTAPGPPVPRAVSEAGEVPYSADSGTWARTLDVAPTGRIRLGSRLNRGLPWLGRPPNTRGSS